MTDHPRIETHEESFLRSFIQKHRRERLHFDLRKNRARFLDRFAHTALDYVDPRFVEEIEPPNSDPEQILGILKSKGAKADCYSISTNDTLDGRILRLSDALKIAVGFGSPTILSCLPGELAYLETEQQQGPPSRFVLSRSLPHRP